MKKIYKLLVIIIVLTLGVFLVKQNVTATKELKVDMGSSIALEIKSEVVQKIYSDLIYLDGDFIRDDFYKYTYFQFENDLNIITNEKKQYLSLNSIYRDNLYRENANGDGTKSIFIKKKDIEDRMSDLFINDNIEINNAKYFSSDDCGIVDQKYKNDEYEFIIKECSDLKELEKMKLVSAEKKGNFIYLKIKAFLASGELDKNGKFTNYYYIKNFSGTSNLDKIHKEDLVGSADNIFDNYEIDEYIFSYKLKNDRYTLTSVQKI